MFDNRAVNSALILVSACDGSDNTDGHVRAIKRDYDSLGRIFRITSTANSDGSGTVRNQIEYEWYWINPGQYVGFES